MRGMFHVFLSLPLSLINEHMLVWILKKNSKPWLVQLSCLGCLPVTKRAGLIPYWSTCLGGGFNPRSGCRGETNNQCFSLTLVFLCIPSSLSKSNKKMCSQVKIKKSLSDRRKLCYVLSFKRNVIIVLVISSCLVCYKFNTIFAVY